MEVNHEVNDAIRAWARERAADLDTREYDNALLAVGLTKPLGAVGGPSVAQVRARATRELRTGCTFRVDKAPGAAGAWVYAMHPPALHALLAARASTLLPTMHPWRRNLLLSLLRMNPWLFVNWIRKHKAPPLTPIYDLIADCYGDKTGPLEALLDSLQAACGWSAAIVVGDDPHCPNEPVDKPPASGIRSTRCTCS